MITVFQCIMLFLVFCIIHIIVDLVGFMIKGKLMRVQQKQQIDDLILSISKGILSLKLKMRGIDSND